MGWVEGMGIIVAIFIVVMVGAVNDWQKERQFMKLNKKKEDRMVKVIRSGKTMKVSVYEAFVGDVMIMDQGDVIPVDGIYIDGYNVSCDESSATGESDLMKKTPAIEVWKALQEGRDLKKMDPFILSGAKVSEGVGSFLVTAVGVHSSYGKTMMALREDGEITPLQYKLNILAGYIAKLGSAAGLLLFTVTFIEFLARLPNSDKDAQGKAQEFLRLFITAVTIIVVAVPEGLPLAVTLALAFATKRMTKDNNLVRHLQSCETMGNATVICSDKTGTLTQNVMTVVVGMLGSGGFRFGDKNKVQEEAVKSPEAGSEPASATSEESAKPKEDAADGHLSAENGKPRASSESSSPHVTVTMNEISNKPKPELREIFKQAIAINTTAFEGEEDGKAAFVGSKTETALLDWAKLSLGLVLSALSAVTSQSSSCSHSILSASAWVPRSRSTTTPTVCSSRVLRRFCFRSATAFSTSLLRSLVNSLSLRSTAARSRLFSTTMLPCLSVPLVSPMPTTLNGHQPRHRACRTLPIRSILPV